MAKAASGKSAEKFETQIQRVSADGFANEKDTLAVEEPLEIRLGFSENGKQIHKAISITMRTPGNDFELAAGFLFTEGIFQLQKTKSNQSNIAENFRTIKTPFALIWRKTSK